MEQREVSLDYQKWLSTLMGFEFEIHYNPGASNKVADALSRKVRGDNELGVMETICGVPWAQIQAAISKDDFIQKVMHEIVEEGQQPFGFSVADGKLRYKGRLMNPANSDISRALLREYHDSPIGGHVGELKTYLRLAQEWYWVGMRKEVARYVQSCAICQQQKTLNVHPSGLLQPLPIPTQVWEDISMDFIEGLLKSQGVDTVLVVVDRLTKYAHFIGLKHPFSAVTVAGCFNKKIVRLHGFPSSIVSNRDRVFLSIFWKELFRLQGTRAGPQLITRKVMGKVSLSIRG